ncbi:nucleotidyltransferase family protein [Paenibacillus thermotolerans]|uniref:nucleotidyltransferase family protein n=1 Tax=Paenibacillus thermotolerans TaxID=3027807 RepID=UPI0023684444|nr:MULTISPECIES: nucleotidyltransferase family protein [unclassified Paenibacillus]
MNIETEAQILQLVKEDEWMMGILRTAGSLQLPDWWVCAGFVRAKIWDVLHGFAERTKLPDVDVIYFDPSNTEESAEKLLEAKLHGIHPGIPWSVKNEARMHKVNGLEPYMSSVDAISKFPETATALGLKLDVHDEPVLAAPCGIGDAIGLKVRPTPFFQETLERASIYEERIVKKNWKQIWDRITVIHIENKKQEPM